MASEVQQEMGPDEIPLEPLGEKNMSQELQPDERPLIEPQPAEPQPEYNARLLFWLRIFGHSAGAFLTFWSAFPALASTLVVLLLRRINLGGATAISVINVVGKDALVAYFYFPEADNNLKFIAQTNRAPITRQVVLKKVGLYAAGIPTTWFFGTYNDVAFDDLAALINANKNEFGPGMINLAAWVKTPFPQVTAFVSSAWVNFFSCPTVMLYAWIIGSGLYKEFKALRDDDRAEKIKFYAKLAAAVILFGLTEWGLVFYIKLAVKLFEKYWNFNAVVAIIFSAIHMAMMSLVALDCAAPLAMGGTVMLFEMIRREYDYPPGYQIAINLLKAAVTAVFIVFGALHLYWGAEYIGIGAATAYMAAFASAILETFGMYMGCTLAELGIKLAVEKCQSPRVEVLDDIEIQAPNKPEPQSWKTWMRNTLFGRCCGDRGKSQEKYDNIINEINVESGSGAAVATMGGSLG